MIEIVQNMPTFPPALRVGLMGLWNLHGANQGSGIVYDESCNGEPANGVFVGRPALHFAPTGFDTHDLTPATAADNIPFFGNTGSRTLVVEIRPDTPLTSGFLAKAATFPQLYLTGERKIAFRYIGVDGADHTTITHPHVIADGVRSCVKITISISGTGVVTLHVDNCEYPTSIDETGIIAEPISDWNRYHPTLNSADVTLIGGRLRAYVTSMAWFSGELSADESIMLSRFPLHYMQSDFGGKLIDGMSFREGTGATLSTKAGRTWNISGATWDVGTHGGQTWTRSSGEAGDRFQNGGSEFAGTNGCVLIGNPAKLQFTPRTQAYSVSVIFRLGAALAGNRTIIARAVDTASARHFWLYRSSIHPDRIIAFIGGVNTNVSGFTVGKIHIVTITVPAASDGGRCYRDGVDTGANLRIGEDATTPTTTWRIGASETSGTNYHEWIGAAAIHNRVLSPAEVAQLHGHWRAKYGA